jgi:hypothetical protein
MQFGLPTEQTRQRPPSMPQASVPVLAAGTQLAMPSVQQPSHEVASQRQAPPKQ